MSIRISDEPIDAVDIILASTSTYRRELLSRIVPRFRQMAPSIDEVALPHELPDALATRLAHSKANAIASRCANTLIIGSDQVAICEGHILGKPGDFSEAVKQLQHCSGKIVYFYTALCIVDSRHQPPKFHAALDITRVVFRELSDREISHYLEREQPYDCAGSFKSEKLGIALFERIETNDPTALVGLPLIAVFRLLREAGIRLLE